MIAKTDAFEFQCEIAGQNPKFNHIIFYCQFFTRVATLQIYVAVYLLI